MSSLHKEINIRTTNCQHFGTLHAVAEEQALYHP